MEFRGNQSQPASGRSNPEVTRETSTPAASSLNNQAGGGAQPVKRMQMQQNSTKSGNSKMIAIAGIGIAVLIVLAALVMGLKGMNGGSSEGVIKKDKYQAVFLTNGQVYFGKVSDVSKQYVKLTDIYYLQVQQQNVQPDQTATTADGQPQVSLAKLGSELHGPDDAMFISRDQVLFWENLKDNGKVTEAIKSDKSK